MTNEIFIFDVLPINLNASSASWIMETNPPLARVPFGRPMREKHFLLHPNYLQLNHASFGTYPKYVQQRLHEVQALYESRPDVFVRKLFPPMLDESRRVLAELLRAPQDEVVYVPNASVAANTVLRNLTYAPRDAIIVFSTGYSAVQKTIASLQETQPGLQCVIVDVTYPVTDAELIAAFRKSLEDAAKSGQRARVAIFDTVSSLPAVRLPWVRLVAVCKEHGVLSFIDGAHGAGLIELDLAEAQPDFWTTNLHKWLFVPRACAALYVPKRNQHLIRTTLPTSHGYRPLGPPIAPLLGALSHEQSGDTRPKPTKKIFNPLPSPPPEHVKSAFVHMFEFVATYDVSPYVCIPAALEFRQAVCGGETEIMRYCNTLAREGGLEAVHILYAAEETSEVKVQWTFDQAVAEGYVLENAERNLTRDLAMIQVRLPLDLHLLPDNSGDSVEDRSTYDTNGDDNINSIKCTPSQTRRITSFITSALMEEHDAFMPCFLHGHSIYTRLSAQVYLDIDDFRRGARALRDVCTRIIAGEVPLR